MKDLFGEEHTVKTRTTTKSATKKKGAAIVASTNEGIGLNSVWRNFGEAIKSRGNSTP